MGCARRVATVAGAGLLTLGLLAPAASAQSCLAQEVEIGRETFGEGFGKELVSVVARNPENLGASNLGAFVSFVATADHDDCPLIEE